MAGWPARVIGTVSNVLSRPALPQKNFLSLISLKFDREGPVVSPGTDDGDAGKPPQNQDLSKMIFHIDICFN